MRKSLLRARKAAAFALMLVPAFVLLSCDDDDEPSGPTQETFSVTMNGANERPDPVTTTATGTAQLSFTGSGPITFSVSVTNLSSLPVGAHIHGPASATATGQVIVGLAPVAQLLNGSLVTGTLSATGVAAISLDSLKVLLRNGNAYVNVHTVNFPDGEIRGTIVHQ